MALVKCIACGGVISDKAKECPHCGTVITAQPCVLSPTICEECGEELDDCNDVCPKCGCPREIKKSDSQIEDIAHNSPISSMRERISAKSKTIICVVIIAIVALVGYYIINQNVLFGDDKIAYEMVVEIANNFKNPSSVRLISGTVGVDKDCLFCGLSATNGFGARTTSYYFIMGGLIMMKEDPTQSYMNTSSLNIEKINKSLERTLGSY